MKKIPHTSNPVLGSAPNAYGDMTPLDPPNPSPEVLKSWEGIFHNTFSTIAADLRESLREQGTFDKVARRAYEKGMKPGEIFEACCDYVHAYNHDPEAYESYKIFKDACHKTKSFDRVRDLLLPACKRMGW